jgi:hypothetical protein
MLNQKSCILVDTNVIIESFRVNCWNLIDGYFKLNTVARCMEEINTGNRGQSGNIPVDTSILYSSFSPQQVTKEQLIKLKLKLNGLPDLDAGEEELLAYALSLGGKVYFLCSPDRAFVNGAAKLSFLDKLVSLEEMTKTAGGKINKLKYNFTDEWLKKEKTRLAFNAL